MKQLKLQLNDVLQKLLISSGWTFDRKIDLFKDEDFLKLLDEYLFFHSAREFLESFYKICINPSSNKTNNDFVRCKVYFDPNTALGESDRLEDWEAEVNEN